MKNKKYLFGGLLVAAFFTYLIYPPQKAEEVTMMERPYLPAPDHNQDLVSKKSYGTQEMEEEKPITPRKETSITQAELQAVQDNLPSEDQVTDEVRMHPHTPSQSLMDFAKKVAPLMEKAFMNEEDAKVTVDEMQKCASDDSASKAARAMCIKNTERLAESYPILKDKAEKLRASVSPEVRKILDTNDAFIKK